MIYWPRDVVSQWTALAAEDVVIANSAFLALRLLHVVAGDIDTAGRALASTVGVTMEIVLTSAGINIISRNCFNIRRLAHGWLDLFHLNQWVGE